MKRIVVSDTADAALTDIYRYTEETWGTRQADKYVGSLLALCDDIAAGLILKRPIPPEFGVTGFVTRHGSHFVYWHEITSDSIGIATVLHTSMIQGERLKDAFGN